MVTKHPLRSFRLEQVPPLKKADLARLLNVSKTTIARWEEGRRKIDPELVPNIAEKTGISAQELRPDLADVFAQPTPEGVGS